MPEINYQNFEAQLNRLSKFPVFLLYGEELLYKRALNIIKNALAPDSAHDGGYEPIEGDDVYDALERVSTYSLLGGKKIVGLLDSKVFLTVKDTADIIEKAKQAYFARELKRSAGLLLKVFGLKNLSLDQADKERSAWYDQNKFGDGGWVSEILDYCHQHNLRVPKAKDPLNDICTAVEKGFPTGNYLIITAETVHKQRKLYKSIAAIGLVVDCSVASGSRWADQQEQEKCLRDLMTKILADNNKRAEPKVFEVIYELTGFDLRIFTTNVEKLINYVGQRGLITVADVNKALSRTKTDPIYTLTEAVAERNLSKALFTMNILLSSQMLPLQILGAITNQMRRLLTASCFLASPRGRSFRPNMKYPQFQQSVMREVTAFDQENERQLSAPATELAGGKKSKTKPQGMPDELILARSPKTAYPVFILLKMASQFQTGELLDAIEALNQADEALKTGAHNPIMILEKIIINICRPLETSKH